MQIIHNFTLNYKDVLHMTSNIKKATQTPLLHLDKDYMRFLKQFKERLQTAQIRASLAANTEQI